jgi:hypothetical protein
MRVTLVFPLYGLVDVATPDIRSVKRRLILDGATDCVKSGSTVVPVIPSRRILR